MGIMVNDTEFKICQLANETTLFLKDKLSLELAINHLFKRLPVRDACLYMGEATPPDPHFLFAIASQP